MSESSHAAEPPLDAALDVTVPAPVTYVQCSNCVRYRALCHPSRACPRCIDRHLSSSCSDSRPPCSLCAASGHHCDRKQPCGRCKNADIPESDCIESEQPSYKQWHHAANDDDTWFIDWTNDRQLYSDLSLVRTNGRSCGNCYRLKAQCDYDSECGHCRSKGYKCLDAPTVPNPSAPVDAVNAPTPSANNTTGTGLTRRRNDAELLETDALYGAIIDGDDVADSTEPMTVNDAELAMAPFDITKLESMEDVNQIQWYQPKSPANVSASTDADSGVIGLSSTEAASQLTSHRPVIPPGFIADLTPVLPRAPLLSLSHAPSQFLNLWAHHLRTQSKSIDGHIVQVQGRQLTAWDVYRAVIENGGLLSVMQQHRYHHTMRSAIVRATAIDEANQSLPGGPPLLMDTFRPKNFLLQYCEKFLYHFEHSYQWKPGFAPSVDFHRPLIPQLLAIVNQSHSGNGGGTSDRSRKRRRRAVAGVNTVKNELLKKLWEPSIHQLLFKPPHTNPASVSGSLSLDRGLGYIGAERLVRALECESLLPLTHAINELLVLSYQCATVSTTGTVTDSHTHFDTDDAMNSADDDDASDVTLLFRHDLPNRLLSLLLLQSNFADTLTMIRRLTDWPDIHSCVLVILSNLSQDVTAARKMANSTNFINSIFYLLFVRPSEIIEQHRSMTIHVLSKILARLSPYIELRTIIHRKEYFDYHLELMTAMIASSLQSEGDGDDDRECSEFVRVLLLLLVGTHHHSNAIELAQCCDRALVSVLVRMCHCRVALFCPLTSDWTLKFFVFAFLSDQRLARLVFDDIDGLNVLTTVANETGDSPRTLERRRSASAAIQAMIAYAISGHSDWPITDYWPAIEASLPQLLHSAMRDADTSHLLAPLLQACISKHGNAQQAPAQ